MQTEQNVPLIWTDVLEGSLIFMNLGIKRFFELDFVLQKKLFVVV